ncbi:MFS-type Sugar/inositol transporter [Penicillium ucsense]|uniref:MFS-type Sugar/inositol transporter n=1 Tax=Penicillium ucsense TaxID=2839758 RepID=A0A8J8W566_9EURO|nr:MFS-type Sugar/inositol transporter [Penicillium ucsense]KAF7738987.1 MFS-type Sugar/inositol transporter [Penicillium ucsense]
MPYLLVTFCCAFAALGSFLFGYDSGVISSSIEQNAFLDYFGSPGLSDAASGGIISSYTGGAIVGSLLAPYISDLRGRRMIIFVGGLLATLGAGLQGGAITVAMLIAGRFIAGLAVGLMSATIPVYCSEVAPPRIRGLLASMQQWMVGLGIMVAQWVGYGCSLHRGNFAWRFPLSFQAVPAVLLVCGILFLPESPRWLIEHDKEAAGRAVLTRLHLNANASNQELVDRELHQIHESVLYEKQLAVRSWRQLLFSRQWRYRILLACGLQAMTQCSGVNVIQNYGPRLYKTLGMSTSTSLMIIGISGALAQLWNTIFMTFIDKVGRRKLLIPSLLGMGAAMCVEATLAHYVDFGDANSNQDALRAAIAMFFVFSLFFTALGMISWIYQSEIFPTAIRARGSAIATATNWSSNLIFAQCTPIALTSIGSQYFYVFVAFNWASVIIVWYWYPETVGKTLEEVEQVFWDSSQGQEPAGLPATITAQEVASSSQGDKEWTPPLSHHYPHHQHHPQGVHPLSMHPIKSDNWSSRSVSSLPGSTRKQMDGT